MELGELAQTSFSPICVGLGPWFIYRWIGGVEAHLFCIELFALTSLVFELWGKNGVNLALPAVLHGEIFLFARWR